VPFAALRLLTLGEQAHAVSGASGSYSIICALLERKNRLITIVTTIGPYLRLSLTSVFIPAFMSVILRCTGWPILVVLFCAFSPEAWAQRAGDLLAAEDYVAEAKAFQERGTRMDHLKAGLSWYKADSLDRAREAYHIATLDAEGRMVIDSITGLALHKTGVICYDQHDDAGAIQYYRKAITVRDKIFPKAHNDRAHSRTNLATCLRFVGQLDSAVLVTRQTVALYEELAHPDTINWLRCLNELADIALEMEDRQLANSSFATAERLLLAHGRVLAVDTYNSYYLGIRTALNFENYDRAIHYAERAISVAEEAEQDTWLADALAAKASAFNGKEVFAAAEADFQRAVALVRSQDPSSTKLIAYYLNLAIIATEEPPNYPMALAYCQQAEKLITPENTQMRFELVLRQSAILTKTKRYEEALSTLTEGFGILTGVPTLGDLPVFNPDSLSSGVYTEAARLVNERAEVLVSLGRKEAARADYECFFQLLELLRGRVNSDDSRRYLSKDLRTNFDLAIKLYLSDDNPGSTVASRWRAFELSEQAKAYSLLAALQQNRNAMPQREADLRTRIAELERRAANDESTNGQLEAARLQLDRMLEQGKAGLTLPDYTLDREALQQLLAKKQSTLLAYYTGRDAGYLFHLPPGGELSIKQLDPTKVLTGYSDQWRSALAAGAYRLKSLRPLADQLTQDSAFLELGLLLVDKLLPDELPSGHLTIIPDGPLSYLPFAALPTRHAALPLRYQDLSYLQDGRTIAHAYSARFLLELQQLPEVKYDYNLLAFAPEFRGATDLSTDRAIFGNQLRSLPGLSPLRYNKEEVAEISGMIGGSLTFSGKKANRQRFLDYVGHARIVHLSSHGMVNTESPNLSFVAFSQMGGNLELEELLYFNDLSALPLAAELAVLSACETNLGKYVAGENVLSLASAFTAAGARSTLTTLWSVNDEATKELMVAFYRALTEGKTRSEALAAAQAEHRENPDFAHPYYWSAMTLYGDDGVLALSSVKKDWWLPGGGLAILLLLLGGWLFSRTTAKR
jgi:CHAT domain-containing protein